jgi:hypothetical protein
MHRPRGWTFPQTLTEGQTLTCTFDREDFPDARAVAIDSADRIWPRRRWFRVKRRALAAGRFIGWPWQRNGPTERQIDRALEAARKRLVERLGSDEP